MTESFDVFLSHAHVDAEWVQILAKNLVRLGIRPFLDRWEIGPGDVLVHELDRGLRSSKSGVLVVSPEALARSWVQQEYAAMVRAAVEHGRRLVPVLYRDAEMPPLLANFLWIDFRGLDGERYFDRVKELAAVLRGKPKGPPTGLGGELQPPPGSGMRAAGPVRRLLVIGDSKATLLGGEAPVTASAPGVDPGTEEKLWQLQRAFARRPADVPLREVEAEGKAIAGALHGAQVAAGTALAKAFLGPSVVAALREAAALASGTGSSLELGIAAIDELADLPWETLCLPAGGSAAAKLPAEPLALRPGVHLYRAVAGEGPTTEWQVPGPLRILVAIGSPEAQNERGELLDMEAELGRILDAVEPARRSGKAYVRVLERGTVRAIHDALALERYHVLHVSCHAVPGMLFLEDEHGGEEPVPAERLWQAIPANRGVSLVVLAGCATALAAPAKSNSDGDQVPPEPGLARELLAHGVPAVLAMQRPVGDRYATLMAAALYGALATSAEPEPLAAVARARASVEASRGEEPRPEQLSEWSTPVLFLRTAERTPASALRLYDPAAPFDEVRPPAEPVLRQGVIQRRVGEFVGRRSDLRRLLGLLRGSTVAGAVIRGIGGVGKSTLAAEVAQALGRDGWAVASVVGETSPEEILEETGRLFLASVLAQRADEKHPLRQAAATVRERSLDPMERVEFLNRQVLPGVPLLLLLDNFEDNLELPGEGKVRWRSDQLKEFLATWLGRPGRSRMLFTCRYPVTVAGLADRPLGPLSPAETRKLFWRLPGLDALGLEDKLRAAADIGGHPRALEYLDALLRGGEARFDDVAERLEAALLEKKGIADPAAWMAERQGDYDQALAAAVTLITGEVLLERLLQGFADRPLAWPLLLGASVYRRPIEEAALRWQVGEVPELPEKEAEAFPEVAAPAGFEGARQALERAGLLATAAVREGKRRYAIHRWTATSLAKFAGEEELAEAHRRAAYYWDWRLATASRRFEEGLEARYHFHLAGETSQAVELTNAVCERLDVWGAWRQEEQLYREALSWDLEQSDKASIGHNLGTVLERRGSYDEALEWYCKSLVIFEELGDAASMASSYQQLGTVSCLRGSYDEALNWHRKALAIKEKLGDRAGMANSYQNMGSVAQQRGSYGEALEWYRKALAVFEDIGSRAGMATSYQQMGDMSLLRKSYDEALEWYRKSLAIQDELGNRAGMASSYQQLGVVAQQRASYDEALEWYRKSLAIQEDLGNRAGIAASYAQLSLLFTELGKPEEALPYGLRCLALAIELQSPQIQIILRNLTRQRELLTEDRFRQLASEHLDVDSVAWVGDLLDRFAASGAAKEDQTSEAESDLATMAADPEIRRELRAIDEELRPTEADGLGPSARGRQKI